jgi:Putative MetA-pathway of phenol degradation
VDIQTELAICDTIENMNKPKSYRDTLSLSAMLAAAVGLSALAWGSSAFADETSKPICADRPNKAVSPCTVDAGHWQVEVDVADFTHDKTGGVTSEMGIWGAPNVKYGVNSRLDLELNIVPYETLHTSGSSMASGFGDLTARAKYAVLSGDTSVTLMPVLKLPTASKTIGNGAVEGGLVVPVGFTLPAGLALALNPEIDAFHDGVGNGTHTAYALSGVLSHSLTSEFTGAVELWAAHNDDPAGRLNQASFDLGLAWIPMKDQNLQLDAGANLGLTRDTPNVNVYVGVSRRF